MKTRIVIEVDTEFINLKSDDDCEGDVTKEVETEFHDSIFGMVEEFLQRDDFEQEWLEFLDRTEGEYEYLPQEEDMDFNKLGKVSIVICKEEAK